MNNHDETGAAANALHAAINNMPTTAKYPDAFALSARHRELEGFKLTGSDASPLTMTDFYQETTMVKPKTAHAATSDSGVDNVPDSGVDSWTDTMMTLVVMLSLLVASSVALGSAARQATVITQQLTRQATQHSLKNVKSPHSWKF